jgi:hypothetical protein
MRSDKSPKPVGVRCSAVSEKSLLIQGILLTCISLQKQGRHSIVHVLDERANVSRIPLGAYSAAQIGSARPIGFYLLSAYAEDEWFRHTN